MTEVLVAGSFDDLRSRDLRFLQSAARRGPVRVLLWSDAAVVAATERPPRFPVEERLYVLEAVRWVDAVDVVDRVDQAEGVVLAEGPLSEFPDAEDGSQTGSPCVIVTGCFDWLHSGHVRFFEEAAAFGDLTVVVGNDENVRLLKGAGHPLFAQEERRYMVSAIRTVHRGMVATGMGWLDAEPEIEMLQPRFYVVNEDGDRPEKRAYCEAHGIRYVVLKRLPRPGLPRRQSTDLRGF